jgi:EpsI family protein
MPENQSATQILDESAVSPRRRVGVPVVVVSLVLLIQIALFYTLSTEEYVPHPPSLKIFQTTVGPWNMTAENELQTDIQELLKADDTLNRQYQGPDNNLNLFVAFFKSQRAGVTPHSPKVCLPGNGWIPENAKILSISVPGEADPIPVNRYTVTRGEYRSVVFYWYQTAHRVVASEYMAKLYLMLDSIRYRRSDTALVRVVVPVRENQVDAADQQALTFINAIYAPLKQQIWYE